jgi:Winged helix-turn helix
LGLSGRVPPRVDQATKAGLLTLLEQACGQGWRVRDTCQVLQVSELRIYRWLGRQAAGRLADHPPGGRPLHELLDEEVAKIIELFHQWGEIDSRTGPTCPQLDLDLRHDPLHPRRGGRNHDRSSSQSQVAGRDRLGRGDLHPGPGRVHPGAGARGLLELVAARQDRLVDPTVDDPSRPVLLALSDNGPQMTSGSTREFMALCAIHQHSGRPGTPTDQAWTWVAVRPRQGRRPHLNAIGDPAMLRAELALVRERYNGVRLHAGIGYVTPNDEHQGRGPAIRKAREAGLEQARLQRLA